MPLNVVIAGASGFLGTHLSRELVGRGHAVERARVDARGRWVPAALVGGGRGTPNQAEDVVSRRTEVGHEGGTDQTG